MTLHVEDRGIAPLNAASRAVPSAAVLHRAAMVVVCMTAALAALATGNPAAALRSDPSLAQLLRGMAALKAVLALAAFVVVWWRLGRATSMRLAAGYIAGVAAMAAGAVLIWRLSFIAQTAVFFHAAMLGLFLLALKDEGAGLARIGPR